MTRGPAPLRVAIVDDHPMFRMGLAAAIEEMDGIELVGEAQQGDQVAALVADAAPDVVLLDVRLADGSGLEVNRWLAEHHPGRARDHADDVGGPRHRAHRAARRRQRLPREGRRARARGARPADGRRRRRRARPSPGARP